MCCRRKDDKLILKQITCRGSCKGLILTAKVKQSNFKSTLILSATDMRNRLKKL